MSASVGGGWLQCICYCTSETSDGGSHLQLSLLFLMILPCCSFVVQPCANDQVVCSRQALNNEILVQNHEIRLSVDLQGLGLIFPRGFCLSVTVSAQ